MPHIYTIIILLFFASTRRKSNLLKSKTTLLHDMWCPCLSHKSGSQFVSKLKNKTSHQCFHLLDMVHVSFCGEILTDISKLKNNCYIFYTFTGLMKLCPLKQTQQKLFLFFLLKGSINFHLRFHFPGFSG